MSLKIQWLHMGMSKLLLSLHPRRRQVHHQPTKQLRSQTRLACSLLTHPGATTESCQCTSVGVSAYCVQKHPQTPSPGFVHPLLGWFGLNVTMMTHARTFRRTATRDVLIEVCTVHFHREAFADGLSTRVIGWSY